MSAPKYKPQDSEERGLWTFMNRHPRFTLSDLKSATTCSDYKVEIFTGKLRRRGILRQCAREGSTVYFTVLDLAAALEFQKTKRGTKEGAMWTVMRSMNVFTPPQIALTLASGDLGITAEDVSKYCGYILKAGYLKVLEKASPQHGRPARFRLVRNTGSLPPLKRNLEVIVDQNDDRAVWISGTRI